MSTRYPGGLISRSKPVIVGPINGEGGSAPGVWTLEQASYYTKQGVWPLPPRPRSLYAWGINSNGQLGQNDTVNRSSPVQVGATTNWSSVNCGYYHVLAKKNDGTLWSWGYNGGGALGTGNIINASSPVQIGALTNWSKLRGCATSSFAIKTDGTLWSWGVNAFGELGQNIAYNVNLSSPVQIGSQADWSSIACGSYFAMVLKSTGGLWLFGQNSYGQLGQNDTINRSSPVQLGSASDWSAIGASKETSYAIKTNGTLWSWGTGRYGALGSNIGGVYAFRSSPVQVGALTNWASLGGSGANGFAIKTDGTLWAWGGNDQGSLGINSTISRSSPVQIGSLTNWSNISGLSGDGTETIAVKTDGTLWAWGSNSSGQLGQNNRVYRSSPVQVGGSSGWEGACNGFNFMVAIQKQ